MCVCVCVCVYRGIAAQVEEQVIWTGCLQGQTQSVEVAGLNLWSVGTNTVSICLHRHLYLMMSHDHVIIVTILTAEKSIIRVNE